MPLILDQPPALYVPAKPAIIKGIAPFVIPVMGKAASASGPTIAWNTAAHYTLSGSNKVATFDNLSGYFLITSSTTKASGKWYVELTPVVGGGDQEIGFSNGSAGPTNFLGGDANGWGWEASGQIYNGGLSTAANTWASGNTIMLAVDVATGNLWFGKNGTWEASGNPGTGANPFFAAGAGITWSIAVTYNGGAGTQTLTLASILSFTVPSGFSAW